jgi:hypothetical protein
VSASYPTDPPVQSASRNQIEPRYKAAKRRRLRYSRQESLDPHLCYRTVRESFDLTWLLSTRAFVIGSIEGNYSLSELGICAIRVGRCVRLSIRDRPSRSPKALVLKSLCPLVYRPYVSGQPKFGLRRYRITRTDCQKASENEFMSS